MDYAIFYKLGLLCVHLGGVKLNFGFYSDKENQPAGTQPPKDLFKDFIQGLESIDKLPPEDGKVS